MSQVVWARLTAMRWRRTAVVMGADNKRVLVCGATGYLGRYLVKCAHERGYWVRALVRNADRLGDARESCDDVFEGQATDLETLAGMCDDIDVVISSLGNRTTRRKPSVWDVDYGANMNIVETATQAGVKQFIFVSVLGGEHARDSVPQIEARERVVDALKAGDMPWTILRPSGFFNDMSEIFEMARKGSAWILGAGEERFNPVHGADLAAVCVDKIGDASAIGEAFAVGGPDAMTMRELVGLAFEALGKPAKIRSAPPWLLRAAAGVVKPFNENSASLMLMFLVFVGRDAVCEKYGTHHLRDYFAELARKAEGSSAAVRN